MLTKRFLNGVKRICAGREAFDRGDLGAISLDQFASALNAIIEEGATLRTLLSGDRGIVFTFTI